MRLHFSPLAAHRVNEDQWFAVFGNEVFGYKQPWSCILSLVGNSCSELSFLLTKTLLGHDLLRTSSTITRWQRRKKKGPSGLVVVGRRTCEPLNNPTLLSLGGGSHLKRESHPSPIELVGPSPEWVCTKNCWGLGNLNLLGLGQPHQDQMHHNLCWISLLSTPLVNPPCCLMRSY